MKPFPICRQLLMIKAGLPGWLCFLPRSDVALPSALSGAAALANDGQETVARQILF